MEAMITRLVLRAPDLGAEPLGGGPQAGNAIKVLVIVFIALKYLFVIEEYCDV
jgi:hypothetical protein